MSITERRLELRHDGHKFFVVMTEGNSIIVVGGEYEDPFQDFVEHGDLFEWEREWGDVLPAVFRDSPDEYGDLVASVTQTKSYSDDWDWTNYRPIKKEWPHA